MTGSFVAFAIQKGVREIKACESSRPRKHARISSCNCDELSSSANGTENAPLRAIRRVLWFLVQFDAALQDTPLPAERRELEVDPTELRVGGRLAARMGKSTAFSRSIRKAASRRRRSRSTASPPVATFKSAICLNPAGSVRQVALCTHTCGLE